MLYLYLPSNNADFLLYFIAKLGLSVGRAPPFLMHLDFPIGSTAHITMSEGDFRGPQMWTFLVSENGGNPLVS